jgi:scyllo-inositol 2-dehydrogenase (NADP+)
LKTLNLAIIGFGKAAEVYHWPFIQQVPQIRVTKVLERNLSRSQSVIPDVEVIRDIDHILNDPEIDVIVITTPNNFHYEMAKSALLAGKHVVVDKPFTITTAEANELIELAETNRKLITVYHNRILDGPIQTAKSILDKKTLGQVEEVNIHFDRFRPEINIQSWREKDIPGAGLLYDLGSHLMASALYLFGYPDKVDAKLEKQRPGVDSVDYFFITLVYNKFPAKVHLQAGMLEEKPTPHLVLKGSNGQVVFHDLDPQEAALKNGKLPDSPDWPSVFEAEFHVQNNKEMKQFPAGNYSLFYTNLYEAICGNIALLVKPTFARDVIRIIEEANRVSEKS